MRVKKTERTKLPNSYFSEGFKRGVIEDYLRSGVSKQQILKKYGIKFQGALQHWMRIYGYEDLQKKIPYIDVLNQIELKKKYSIKPQTTESLKEASQQEYIKQLESQLENEKLRSEAYKKMIEIAEKEFKISIKKKSNTK